MQPTLKAIVRASLFVALGVTLGFILANVPNVELISATVFLGGYFLGIRQGLLIGLVTEAVYSLLNPYGLAAPTLFLGQITAMAFTGGAGGLYRRLRLDSHRLHLMTLGLTGGILTLDFAFLTTVGYLVAIGLNGRGALASIFAGLGFYLTHILSNILIFLSLVPSLIQVMDRINLFETSPARKAETI